MGQVMTKAPIRDVTARDASGENPAPKRSFGIGSVLIAVYIVMALGASARSFVQIVERFDEAPLAYSLSAASAVVYILAALALVFSRRSGWYVVAWIAICFELIGVLVIGTLSITHPALFQHPSVWSEFGKGYIFVPLVLPLVGLWYLIAHRPSRQVGA